MNGKGGELKRWYKHGEALLHEIAASQPQPGESHIWFAGQHGFIISLGGMVFYIDVILNDILDKDGNTRRVYPPPFEPAAIQRVDYVLCSHNHLDHLNLDTLLPLAQANPKAKFVVPAPWKNLLTGAGISGDRVLAAKAEQTIAVNSSLSISPVMAIHTRYIQDDGEKDENGDYRDLGFILKGDGISIYHCGDTWITPSLVQILKAHAPLDIAILPINGTDWERTMINCIGNVSYLDAVKLARAIPVDTVFPSHYDMMAHNSENPARFVDSMYTLCPEKRFHLFALGERYIYRKD